MRDESPHSLVAITALELFVARGQEFLDASAHVRRVIYNEDFHNLRYDCGSTGAAGIWEDPPAGCDGEQLCD